MPTDNKISSSSRGPSAVVVINNYNYGRFLRDAVGSALAQTYANTRVVVIDDGSTDESHEVLSELQRQHPEIEIHYKSNGGQLSCFNATLPYIKDADWVFLLDADDHFPANYVEHMLAAAGPGTAMLLAENIHFDARLGQQPITDCRINDLTPIDVLKSAELVARLRPWLGRPTSALAVRSALYRLIFPYYPERDWRISADQVIVRGASIAGGSKRFVRNIGINYRVHGENNYHGTNYRAHARQQSRPRITLSTVLAQRAGLNVSRWWWPAAAPALIGEIRDIPNTHRRHLKIPAAWHIAAWPILWPLRKCRILAGRTYRWLMSRHDLLYPIDCRIRRQLGRPLP
jgi:hypothetical protein